MIILERGFISTMLDPDPAGNIIGTIFISLFFLLLTILYSLAEESFLALGEGRIRDLEEEGNRKARRIRKMTEKERRFRGCIRLGNVGNAGLAAIAVLNGFLSPLNLWLSDLFGVTANSWTGLLSISFLFLIVIFCFDTFGSLLPRRLSFINPEKTAFGVLGIFTLFYWLLRPLHGLCAFVAFPLLRMVGIDPHEDPDPVTEEDIRELMDAGEELGAIEGVQKDMVNNIFEFDDTTAAEIMTPRIDVTAIEVNDPVEAALTAAVENGYSRLPVYEEDIDHIIGILYVKDLLPYVGRAIPASVTVRSLLRDTHFVPDTKKCDDLFEEMNEKHLQMAIVVDEYGGVAGIVTMEDLLESIVGNMQDEFDNEEEEVTQVDTHSFEVDGSMNVSDLSELIDVELPEGDYDTVAGFLMDQLGHIPEQDEEASVVYKNVTFTIQEMDDRRIEQVLVHIDPIEDDEETKLD